MRAVQQNNGASVQSGFAPGQRVVYVKRGEQRCYDTEWRATYLYRTPAGKHAIRIDGRKRISLVAAKNLEAHDAHP